MSAGWAPSPGHIVRAEVQYADSEQTKSRFPVVVSCNEFNLGHPELIVAFATRSGNIERPRDYDVEISSKHAAFKNTGLTESTTVRCGRLWTIDKRKVAGVIGVVPEDLLGDIQRLVVRCFGKPGEIAHSEGRT
jgi:mRNA-degrading endonuclease toxin of MazEF toxin-antitoxin module